MEKNYSIVRPHPLNTSWIIWYHNPNDKNWDINSYKSILEINTVEDFIALTNSWNKCLPKITQGMYFFMRKLSKSEIIYPRWEDKHNKYGGYWSFKVEEDSSEFAWNQLSKLLIGETISKSSPMNINGISISPKKKFCIIKIWNKSSDLDNSDVLTEQLEGFLNIREVKYSSHNKNIKRDKEKIEKYRRRQKGRHNMTRF